MFTTRKAGDLLTTSDNFLSFFLMNFRFVSSSCSYLNFEHTKMFRVCNDTLETSLAIFTHTHWMKRCRALQAEPSVSSPGTVFMALLGHTYTELWRIRNTRASEDSLADRSLSTCFSAFWANISK